MHSILAIIPARYASTRFPGKPLIDLGGKTMIQRVFEQVQKATRIQKVVVATDDERIFNHVQSFGGHAVMTRADHVSGTDRCYEALQLLKGSFDYVVNVQGDEPFIQPEQIDLLAGALDGNVEIATLAKKIDDPASIFNPNVVKVVFNVRGKALYFSRSPIPHLRKHPENEWINHGNYYKHIGMYAYRTDILKQLTHLPVSALEQTESLEQLRWLDNGYSITVLETNLETLGIDSPEDAERARKILAAH
ncbi:MAG: 3-deoxy-manno-octulosonate cytidylyltransferase [Cyclobacteriaceae bacterium]|nr:3-deoxy-manno-octulosonate cytidylyltransferase [Cyclobacteriaceae bacterium]